VNKKFIIGLLTVAALAGCTSTANVEQASAAPAEIMDKVMSGRQLTSDEIKVLGDTTKFTAMQLREAGKSLGFRCSFFKVTGTHIKNKICSTQQQRDVRAAAAKLFANGITQGTLGVTSESSTL
jgi:hypothetical protein